MKPVIHCFLVGLLALIAPVTVRADFLTGQSADLLLGPPAFPTFNPAGLAIDPLTQKIFVSDDDGHRIFRYTSTQAMQNDAPPEAVLGQVDFFTQLARTTAAGLNRPAGLAVDAAGRLWVADSANHRILRFDNAGSLASGAAAAGVLGQANFTGGTSGLAANRLNTPRALAVDEGGRLWVADTGNHRILRWDNAAAQPAAANAIAVFGQSTFTTKTKSFTANGLNDPTGLVLQQAGGEPLRLWVADTGADRVLAYHAPLGKPNGGSADKIFGSNTFGRGDGGITSRTFWMPTQLALEGTTLWVADTRQHRVLRFLDAANKGNGADADAVLGQAGFTTATDGAGESRLFFPGALATVGGRLWVADTGNRRLVRHESAIGKNGLLPADGTLGHRDTGGPALFSPQASAVDPLSGKLFVTDHHRHRVLRYANTEALHGGSVPEAVLGQPDFDTATSGTTAAKMHFPRGLTVDALGNLWVADSGNHRVLGFGNAAQAGSGAAAAKVFGQPTFTANTTGLTSARMNGPQSVVAEGTGSVTRLWVADTVNHRVLRFENPLTLGNGGAASGVLGQVNFTTATGALGTSGLNRPGGLAVESNGRLWVVDKNNQRVLRFDAAAGKANGASANGVLLQDDFGTPDNVGDPTGVCVSPSGRLFVSLGNGHRVLWFNGAATLAPNSPPNGVLGQPDLLSTEPGWGFTGMGFVHGVALDPSSGQLWVAHENGLLRFSPQLSHLQQWRVTNFGTPASHGRAANDADADGDDTPNLIEYVTSQSPTAAGGIGSTVPIGLTVSGPNQPLLADLRLLGTYDSKVRLTLLRSTTLGTWSILSQRTGLGAWTGVVPSSTMLNGGRTRWTFNVGLPGAGTAHMSFRLLAEELP